jgi:Tfp pilus assembly protein PilZ
MRSGQGNSNPIDHGVVTGRREHPRFALEIDAELRIGDRKLPARTRNVSHGGLAMTTTDPLPIGAEVTVMLALVFDESSMSEPLPLQGRVVWCSPIVDDSFQLGVMFVGVRAEERSYVDMFLRYLKD